MITRQGSKNGLAYNSFLSDLDMAIANLKEPLRSSACFIPIQHYVAQKYSWDCGLACAAMVLSYTLGHSSELFPSLHAMCGTTSVWTIDVAHVLARLSTTASCAITFTTICPGVSPEYQVEEFYRLYIEQDRDRVNHLFNRAHKSGILVLHRSLSSAELQALVTSGSYLVIALIDKSILLNFYSSSSSSSSSSSFSSASPSSSYTGHFVLIHGFDSIQNEFYIKDPSLPQLTTVPADVLDAARNAHGTDQDLLFIRIENTSSHHHLSIQSYRCHDMHDNATHGNSGSEISCKTSTPSLR